MRVWPPVPLWHDTAPFSGPSRLRELRHPLPDRGGWAGLGAAGVQPPSRLRHCPCLVVPLPSVGEDTASAALPLSNLCATRKLVWHATAVPRGGQLKGRARSARCCGSTSRTGRGGRSRTATSKRSGWRRPRCGTAHGTAAVPIETRCCSCALTSVRSQEVTSFISAVVQRFKARVDAAADLYLDTPVYPY